MNEHWSLLVLPVLFCGLAFAYAWGRWFAGVPSYQRTHVERLELHHAWVGHALACALMIGFLAAIFMPLTGFVDMTDQITSNMVFYIIGAIQGPLGRVLGNYTRASAESDDDIAPPDPRGDARL